jgi:FG-GAP repeat
MSTISASLAPLALRSIAATAAVALFTHAAPAEARTHFNSLTRMKTSVYKNLLLADVDGDGRSDLIGFTQNQYGWEISVGSADYTNARKAIYDIHLAPHPEWTNIYIDQIFTGHFDRTDRESICFRGRNQSHTDWYYQSIYCFLVSGSTLTPTTSEPSPWTWDPGDATVVGDFDGDGYDELMTYTPSNGSNLEIYQYNRGTPYYGFWNLDWDRGNLNAFSWAGGVEIYAGDFADFASDGSARRDDLLIFNKTTKQVARFDARVWAGRPTFWWAFTSGGGAIGSTEEIGVADADGNGFEDLIPHDTATGTFRFQSMTSAALPALAWRQPEAGQLPTFTSSPTESHAYWGVMKSFPGEGGGTNLRDDSFVYVNAWDAYVRNDARYCAPGACGTSYGYRTYWYYYSASVAAIKSALGMSYYE